MSHIVTIRTRVKDPLALSQACLRLGLPAPVQGTAKLYAAPATGWIVPLPGWTYPVVFTTETGEVRYDHFAGRWGDPKELDKLLQAYAVEKVRLEARRTGHTVTEQPLPDGSIKLVVARAGR